MSERKFAASRSAAVTVSLPMRISPGGNSLHRDGDRGPLDPIHVERGAFRRIRNSVWFSCTPVPGVTCSFNPAVITPTNGTANTVLTVTTSSSVVHLGF